MPILPNVDNETELLLWCKQTAASHQHLVGGNLIGKVVDPKDFQVYGVKNLHVVDASILPEQPSTHPQMTIYRQKETSGNTKISFLPATYTTSDD